MPSPVRMHRPMALALATRETHTVRFGTAVQSENTKNVKETRLGWRLVRVVC